MDPRPSSGVARSRWTNPAPYEGRSDAQRPSVRCRRHFACARWSSPSRKKRLTETPTTFEELLVDLSRHDVEYILAEGLAVALCGFVRTTLDVDILIRVDRENIQRLLDRLVNFGEGHAKELSVDDFKEEEGSIRVVENFPVDVFTMMSGNTYEDLLPLTATYLIGDVEIVHLNAGGLIQLKADSLRPKDRIDVEALRDIQRRSE